MKNNVYDNVLGLIGNTPLVKVTKFNTNKNVRIYAKLEGQNPGGSIKDRIGLKMIEDAEKNGELTKDKIIIEPTSGNTGIGLAMVAAVKGYKIQITMSAAMSDERKKALRAFGAELIETDPTKGTDGAIVKAHELLDKNPNTYWMPNQFENDSNPLAHYVGTAEEIISQMPKITHFIAGMGTSGTLMGVSKRLKEYNSKIEIIGVEPILGHKVAGLKNMQEAIQPKIYNEAELSRKINVNDENAYETSRQLALKEGIFVGMSSGAAMFAALELANSLEKGNIVVILPDRGDRYTSTNLFG
ncbi:MAG: cysteine synthase family protein [Patescibacteria group bacterium]